MTAIATRSPADIAGSYFEKMDSGATDLYELFAEGFEFYFPKFGTGKGKDDFAAFLTGLVSQFANVAHRVDRSKFIVAGDKVIVEGTTSGRMKSGTEWQGGKTPGGRFCNVFEIRNGLIERVYIYLDPDYASKDAERFLWKDRKSVW